MQGSKSHQAHAKARGPRRRIFTGAVAVAGSVGLAAAVLLPSGPALAAYQQGAAAPPDSSIVSVVVGPAIELTDVTPAFSLGGTTALPLLPGDTPAPVPDAVTMNVFTNNTTGYNVNVVPMSNMWTANSSETIPASDLSVQNTADTNSQNSTDLTYTPLSAAPTTGAAAPTPVYDQATASPSDGNTISEDWEFNQAVPDVPNGTYSVQVAF
ncbi:MAG: hypothetical protein ABSF03_35330, partial [Streptosporangiaceae bacterium]